MRIDVYMMCRRCQYPGCQMCPGMSLRGQSRLAPSVIRLKPRARIAMPTRPCHQRLMIMLSMLPTYFMSPVTNVSGLLSASRKRMTMQHAMSGKSTKQKPLVGLSSKPVIQA